MKNSVIHNLQKEFSIVQNNMTFSEKCGITTIIRQCKIIQCNAAFSEKQCNSQLTKGILNCSEQCGIFLRNVELLQ